MSYRRMPVLIVAVLGIKLVKEVSVGELLVAGGTLLLATFTAVLAGFTWRLARQTSKEVEQSRQEIELSREAIEAADRPFVIVTSRVSAVGYDPTLIHFVTERDDMNVYEDRWSFPIRLWNIGKGPAIVDDVRLTREGEEILQATNRERPVAAGDDLIENWQLADESRLPEDGEGELRISYRAGSGRRYVTTQRAVLRGQNVTCSNYRRIEAEQPPK